MCGLFSIDVVSAGQRPSQHSSKTHRPRRTRTKFSHYQILCLENRFLQERYISLVDRLYLAMKLRLMEEQVEDAGWRLLCKKNPKHARTDPWLYLPSVNLLFSIDALRVSQRVLCQSHRVEEHDRDMPLLMLKQRRETGVKPPKWSFSAHAYIHFHFLSCSNAAISRSKYGTCLGLLSIGLTAALFVIQVPKSSHETSTKGPPIFTDPIDEPIVKYWWRSIIRRFTCRCSP